MKQFENKRAAQTAMQDAILAGNFDRAKEIAEIVKNWASDETIDRAEVNAYIKELYAAQEYPVKKEYEDLCAQFAHYLPRIKAEFDAGELVIRDAIIKKFGTHAANLRPTGGYIPERAENEKRVVLAKEDMPKFDDAAKNFAMELLAAHAGKVITHRQLGLIEHAAGATDCVKPRKHFKAGDWMLRGTKIADKSQKYQKVQLDTEGAEVEYDESKPDPVFDQAIAIA